VIYLVSNVAAMVTGDCIRVDGAVKSSLGNDFSEVCAHLSFSPPQFFSAFSSSMLFGTLLFVNQDIHNIIQRLQK
jgi:hypothetical protein